MTCLPKFLAVLLAAAVVTAALPPSPARAQDDPAAAENYRKGAATGLRIPRFVSLKSDNVNVRVGPSREHGVAWRYVRAGMPVEVTQEFDNWRRIRDYEGAEGWVFHALLSGVRTAIVAPWDKSGTPVAIYASAAQTAAITAKLEPGVQGNVSACDGRWCHIDGARFDGWIAQTALWGVYPDEAFE